MIPVDELARLVTAVITAIAFAYGFFQWLGKRWLENQFAKQLERFRHQQAEELERLRFRISTALDRTNKLHQHEFEVLPQIWQRMTTAYAEVGSFVSRLQSYQDLTVLGAKRLDEFLEESGFRDSEKDDIRAARDKNRTYQDIVFWRRAARVNTAYSEFHNYLFAQGIFIQPELKEQFTQIRELIYAALSERTFQQQHPMPGPGRFADGEKLHAEGPKRIEAIEQAVRTRLWDTALDPVAPGQTPV